MCWGLWSAKGHRDNRHVPYVILCINAESGSTIVPPEGSNQPRLFVFVGVVVAVADFFVTCWPVFEGTSTEAFAGTLHAGLAGGGKLWLSCMGVVATA